MWFLTFVTGTLANSWLTFIQGLLQLPTTVLTNFFDSAVNTVLTNINNAITAAS